MRDPVCRFLSRVDASYAGCWNYLGGKTKGGYGVFYPKKGEATYAHRYSYQLFKGSIDEGLVVMHSCDNRKCVNPEHLSQGTSGDNLRDMTSKGRNYQSKKTHCKNGHQFTPENTLPRTDGVRRCKACRQ
jgi:hypothetical protein